MADICRRTKKEFDIEECKKCLLYGTRVSCVSMELVVPKKLARAYKRAKKAGLTFGSG